ncbi:MAG: zinc ribbon domain-containing protein [Blastocatellia bacterium]|nr:zinc ribbon domain-containing protein [Blastocatellia bacterium]
MHCPKCGQQQISEETRFCSRCGLLLAGVAEVLANNGLVPATSMGIAGSSDSRKRRGIKQGVFLFLLTFLIVPLTVMITVVLRIEPFLPILSIFLLGVGGILRIVYALMFESGTGGPNTIVQNSIAGEVENRGSLPPSQSIPASAYASPAAGSWLDTNDLQRQPGSVTDSTTKLLQKEGDQ